MHAPPISQAAVFYEPPNSIARTARILGLNPFLRYVQ